MGIEIENNLEARLISRIEQRAKNYQPPNIIVMSEQTFKNLISEINARYLKVDSMKWFSSWVPAGAISKFMGIEIYRSEDVSVNEFKIF